MTQQEYIDILTRFRHGQCLPADMEVLLDAMTEAPPEGYSTWRMYRLEKEGIILRQPDEHNLSFGGAPAKR